jgi:DNA helicase-2/ATP-dependent DNA helicase PcrA
MADPLLAGLSPEQRDAVLAPPGPVLILAGAGSGKTRVLTHRVAHLLRQGAAPSSLLLMTFTTAAAAEMLRRTEALLHTAVPSGEQGLWAGTFHHVAVRVLRRHGPRLGLRPDFSILDPRDAAGLIAACAHPGLGVGRHRRGKAGAASPGGVTVRPELILRLLSLSVGAELTLEQVLEQRYPGLLPHLQDLRAVLDDYARRKLALGALDFDDLLLFMRLLLCDLPDVAASLQERFRHVLVDEYQDVSPVQGALCDQLALFHRSLTVVGDDAQSIYGFRGAEVRQILSFPTRWPEARVLYLSDNYRSQPEIVALANASIRRNRQRFDKPMRAVRPPLPSAAPLLVPVPDAAAQASFVARRIAELIAAGRAPADIAVLYRGHAHAAEAQLALLRQRVPYRLHSGPRLLQQAHVKDALSHLRLLVSPHDELAWGRVLGLQPGVGPKLRERLLQALRQGALPVDPTVRRGLPEPAQAALQRLGETLAALRAADEAGQGAGDLLELLLRGPYGEQARRAFTDAEDRLGELQHLAAQLRRGRGAQGAASLHDVLAELQLAQPISAAEVGAEAPQRVALSTVHRAKGLEWGVVFVLWLCEGYFPSPGSWGRGGRRERGDPGLLEEERRLFYVAVTRARDQLYLCCPRRSQAGEEVTPSRFVRELEAPLLSRLNA